MKPRGMMIRLGLVGLAILIVGATVLSRHPVSGGISGAREARTTPANERSGTAKRVSRLVERSDSPPDHSRRPLKVARQTLGELSTETASLPTYLVNPEYQPRAYLTADFRSLSESPRDFKLENVELTDEGFRLLPTTPGKEKEPRMGVIESPPQGFDFYSNAVTPMWKESIPDHTDMFVEISMSPDGQNWGDWQWIEVDEDSTGQIAEYYPDGRPNPNYGYTPGSTMAWGLTQWHFVRYRVRLYSECANSPTLSTFRVFYQDSTLGEGQLATPQTMAAKASAAAVPPPQETSAQ